MKETGLAHWKSPNEDATNSSGFTGLPGGYRRQWRSTALAATVTGGVLRSQYFIRLVPRPVLYYGL
jgi:hypothetical protein